MSTIELVERIDSLSAQEREQVLRLVDTLCARDGARRTMPEGLVERIDAQRERLARLYGPFGDSTDDIRRLRDEGR